MSTSTNKDNKYYTEDDVHCFKNIQWEMSELSLFLKDCNHRKITYFKFSLGVMSVFITLFGITLTAVAKDFDISLYLEVQIIITAILLASCLINFSIIKELFSIHSSRVHIIRQMNCLRQAIDGIRYKKHVGNYPESTADLKNESSTYWKVFGKHRKLQIDNHGLRDSEKSWAKSPDMSMIFILSLISITLQFSATIYLISSESVGKELSFICGGVVSLSAFFIVTSLISSRKDLKVNLGLEKS